MYETSGGKEDNTKQKECVLGSVVGEVAVCSGTVAADEGFAILIFFVGFIKEMEEILYVVMMFQKIIYGGQDLS
jgi:hypothetical protein